MAEVFDRADGDASDAALLAVGPGFRAWAEEAAACGGGREGREREGKGSGEEAASAGHGGDISQAVRLGQRELKRGLIER